MTTRTLDVAWHLRAELGRVLVALARLLDRQRRRGRSPAADAVRGLVIEDGEAEGLLAELAVDWRPPSDTDPEPSPHPPPLSEADSIAEAAAAQGVYLPLRHAARAFELESTEYDAVLLALAAELDARFCRLFAYLNDHVAHTRPTVGLAALLAAAEHQKPSFSPSRWADRPFLRDGLVELTGDGPIPGRSLQLDPDIAARLSGDSQGAAESPGSVLHVAESGLLERLILSEPVRRKLAVWAEEMRRRPRDATRLLLAGARGSGRETAARAVAAASGRPLTVVGLDAERTEEKLRLARREARWHDAAILLECGEVEVDPAALWQGLATVDRPVFVSAPPAAASRLAQAAPTETPVLHLVEPDLELRAQLWNAVLPAGTELEEAALDSLAAAFHFSPGRMAHAVRHARSELLLEPPGERRLTAAALHRAARDTGAALMGPLAQKLPLPYEPEDLVVPATLREELDLALAWARRQRRVLGEWGFGRRVPFGYGLAALFSGPSGTGKTMAAQVLARQLDLDLYRVDLSRVMSKYIGETEKNLGTLFDEAHHSGAMLFFDEADALFGKRSEVKDAHDRYANVEIGYLLQRMEEHDGIVVLATNRRQDMDEAFVRRFDVMLEFPMPGEADRLRIWQGMFPAEADREEGLDLTSLAKRFEFSGGEIRNAVLAAAYLAADEDRPIGAAHLRRAVRRELIKSGRVVDEGELRKLD